MKVFSKQPLTDERLTKNIKGINIVSWATLALALLFFACTVILAYSVPSYNGLTVNTPAQAANISLTVLSNSLVIFLSAGMAITCFLLSSILDRRVENLKLTLKINTLEKKWGVKA